MTTALIISELLPIYDDGLLADINHIFDEIDRTVEKTPANERSELFLLVDELVDELLTPEPAREPLSISIELELDDQTVEQPVCDEVAEVA